MKRNASKILAALAIGLPISLAQSSVWAAAPTAEQALRYTPVQKGVEYDRPKKADIRNCTIRAEKIDGQTAWVVRGPEGQLLRKFSDTNRDNVVDEWSYYHGELEVYRDIDANFNAKADQYRWFHTGGTRWGMDENEDGKIDTWRFISAQEVASELIEALRTRDAARFNTLLLTSDELKSLGLGEERTGEIQEKLRDARSAFVRMAEAQSLVKPSSEFLGFGGAQPGLVPAGAQGATKDLLVYENVAALIETDGKSRQVNVGTLVRVGDKWCMFDTPQLEMDTDVATGGFFFRGPSQVNTGQIAQASGSPSKNAQGMMKKLETLDQQIATADPKKQAELNEKRCDILESLAKEAETPAQREQWIHQMADMVGAAVQSGTFPQGIKRLKALEKKLANGSKDESLRAYVKFRRLSAAYGLKLQSPKADFAKIQEKWLEDLEDYVKKHPRSPDTAEAMLQLAVANEFSGEDDKAKGWYGRIVSDFPRSAPAKKASGAKRRLESVGKAVSLRGKTIFGKKIDLSQYRGRVVLIQYWATWCEPCLVDMIELKELQSKYAKSFTVIGVNLDTDVKKAAEFAKKVKLPWHNLHEPGGLESRFANEMGILTLPTMILTDSRGKVVNRNIHISELTTELRKAKLASELRRRK